MENIDLYQNHSDLTGYSAPQRPTIHLHGLSKESRDQIMNQTFILQKKSVDEKKPNFRTTLYKFSQHNIRNKRSTTTKNYIRQSMPRVIVKDNDRVNDPIYSDPSVLSNYQIMTHIGKGAYATVSLAIEKSTMKTYAIKIYEKAAVRQPQRLENILRQIRNLKLLNHKNIVRIEHAISDKRKVFIIMENAGKNSLHSLIRRRQNKIFTQSEAKGYFSQILQAIVCCHQQNICHRDIKLENILINPSNQVKLIDFGFSTMSKTKLNAYCGTPSYMAPQIAAKGFYQGWQVDMWSCGILLYVMLCGSYPFRATDEKELYRKIQAGKYTWREDLTISAGAKRVTSKMLRIAGQARFPASELLKDKWFSEL